LACSIARVGDTYSLTARLIDPNTQLTALTEMARAKNRNEVLPALDGLAGRVRKKLGESLSGMAGPNLPLPTATTASLEALRLFAAARYPRTGQRATDLLEQAVRIDPDFALAHADLGVAYYIDSNRPLGEEHFQKALKLLDRLTLREQLWVRAVVEDWRGNRDDAIGLYESYVAQYPDADDGWFRLGWTRMVTNRTEQAVQAFQKVLEIDPNSSPGYINLATSLSVLKQHEKALANYQKAFALEPEAMYGQYVNHEYGFLLVEVGKIQEGEDTFTKMLARDVSSQARAHRSLALLRMYQGQYAAAIPHLKEAILINRANQAPLSEMRDRLYLARVYRTKGMAAESDAELRAAAHIHATTDLSPDWSLNLGRMFARDGKLEEAAMVLRKAEKAVTDTTAISAVNRDTKRDHALVQALKGEVELARTGGAGATETIELAERLFSNPLTLECVAHAYWKLGNQSEAARNYEKLAEEQVLGNESQEDWIMAHYQLGKIYRQMGDAEKSARYYRKFLDIWKDGDADLPSVLDARKQLTRVQRQ